MSLAYQNATSGKRAIEEIQKLLKNFGCKKFATGEDFETGEVFIQFEHRGRMVSMKASSKGYATMWLKENEYTSRKHCTRHEHESKALEIGSVAVYSILRDWVKSQVTVIESGIMSFEAAFLSQMLLPNGKQVIEEIESQGMLPAPKEALT